nr:MAG TPA: protein of unknown function UPF0697 [Bacteriophage sp.]DAQ60512.1 MAG TPA: protein of unknown function UPF0697 [Bacteriophage sp.]DAU52526.1 MAG TPA: protein of unknown function UPF0697 [Crassvirales sp.]DAV76838.1 MAG TPA: protein of unknown function UPF0697 [Caudoviricetes sp.]
MNRVLRHTNLLLILLLLTIGLIILVPFRTKIIYRIFS